jgi:hypothetical protein
VILKNHFIKRKAGHMSYGNDVRMFFQPRSRARCLIMRQDTSAGKTTPCGIAVCSCVVDQVVGRA